MHNRFADSYDKHIVLKDGQEEVARQREREVCVWWWWWKGKTGVGGGGGEERKGGSGRGFPTLRLCECRVPEVPFTCLIDSLGSPTQST